MTGDSTALEQELQAEEAENANAAASNDDDTFAHAVVQQLLDNALSREHAIVHDKLPLFSNRFRHNARTIEVIQHELTLAELPLLDDSTVHASSVADIVEAESPRAPEHQTETVITRDRRTIEDIQHELTLAELPPARPLDDNTVHALENVVHEVPAVMTHQQTESVMNMLMAGNQDDDMPFSEGGLAQLITFPDTVDAPSTTPVPLPLTTDDMVAKAVQNEVARLLDALTEDLSSCSAATRAKDTLQFGAPRPLDDATSSDHADLIVDRITPISGPDYVSLRTEVGGSVLVWERPGLERARLPFMRHVGGQMYIYANDNLVIVHAPSLQRIDRDLSVFGNNAVTVVSLPQLHSVGQFVSININDGIQHVSLPSLAVVPQYVYVTYHRRLAQMDMPALVSVGEDLVIADNPQLTLIALPSLQSVAGMLFIAGNAAVQHVSLPRLLVVGGSLDISVHTAVNIDISLLVHVGGSLSICQHASAVSTTMLALPVLVARHDTIKNSAVQQCEAHVSITDVQVK